jgi:hypothetical protein
MSKSFFFLNDMPVEGSLNKREVYWRQNCADGCYDPSLKRTFSSKHEMRAYLAKHGMRDAGERVNPSKHITGREKAKHNPVQRQHIQDYIRSQGGTEGLLRKMQKGKMNVG